VRILEQRLLEALESVSQRRDIHPPMPRGELAKLLCDELDKEKDGWRRCRVCGKRVVGGISMAATQTGEYCYQYHRSCYNGLSKKAKASANKHAPEFFDN